MIGIYKITNLINNKIYIGQSINIEQRWKDHRSRAFQNNKTYLENHLYRAIRKYGLDNFSFEVIEECKKEELNSEEVKWIKYYQSDNLEKGYNKTKGGADAITLSKITDEQVIEICELLLHSNLTQREIANKYQVADSLISGINHGTNRVQKNYSYPIRKTKEFYQKRNPNHICPDCGGFKSDIRSELCLSCRAKRRQKVERPSREELKQMIKTETFVSIGKKFGVTDNTIKKWCKAYKLPAKKADIKLINDKDWEKI